jgi:hypothetical protein
LVFVTEYGRNGRAPPEVVPVHIRLIQTFQPFANLEGSTLRPRYASVVPRHRCCAKFSGDSAA